MNEMIVENGILIKYTGTERCVTLHEGITEIASRAFERCNIKEIALPSSLRTVGHGAFWYCEDLCETLLPDTVETVGEGVFVGCAALESVRLPAGLPFLPEDTFRGCASLERVDLPKGVTYIGDSAFEGCASLKRVRLPKALVSVGMKAFSGCSALMEIALPEGLLRIKLDAFSHCERLTAVTVPASVNSIDSAFEGCLALTELRFLREEAFFADIGVFDGLPSPLRVVFGGTAEDFERTVAPSYGELYHVTMGDFARGYRYPMFHRALGKDFECHVLCLKDGKKLMLHGEPYDQLEGPSGF